MSTGVSAINVDRILDVVDRYCSFGELKSSFRYEIGQNGRERPCIHHFGPWVLQRGGSGCGVDMVRTPYLLMTIGDFRSVSHPVLVSMLTTTRQFSDLQSTAVVDKY